MARTAVHRSAALGLGALGALLIATPASALDAGQTVGQLPGMAPAAVDPLVPPVPSLPDPLGPLVEQAVATVEKAVGPVTGGGSTPPPEPPPDKQGTSETSDPEPVAGPPPSAPHQGGSDVPAASDVSATSHAPGTQVAPLARVAPVEDGNVAPAAGTGTVSFENSIAAVDRKSGFIAGTGIAADPMSLFGAPQVAMAPRVEAAVAAPQVFTPAGNQLVDALPFGAPASVPGYLVAVACSLVAGAVTAHVAAVLARAMGGAVSV